MFVYSTCLLNVELMLARLKEHIWSCSRTGKTQFCMKSERAAGRRNFISHLCIEEGLI